MYWTDYSVSLERVMKMKRFQVNTPRAKAAQQEELRKEGETGAVSGTTCCRMKQKCPN